MVDKWPAVYCFSEMYGTMFTALFRLQPTDTTALDRGGLAASCQRRAEGKREEKG